MTQKQLSVTRNDRKGKFVRPEMTRDQVGDNRKVSTFHHLEMPQAVIWVITSYFESLKTDDTMMHTMSDSTRLPIQGNHTKKIIPK